MKTLLLLVALASVGRAADIIDGSECTEYPCLVFSDEFDFFDFDAWEHEITLGGGGNWEFQAYVNNRSVTYTHDGTLFIRPDLTANWKGEPFLTQGTLSVWGGASHNDLCTSNMWYGCERSGPNWMINPVISGRLRTLPYFNVRFGRIEVRAKMPKGDWLWPAIWMLPKNFVFGPWPASGEIDIIEARGNTNYGNLGHQYGASTLHWGPSWDRNQYGLTHAAYAAEDGSFADSFHTWTVEWTDTYMKFTVDDDVVLNVDPGTNFWDFAGLGSTGLENPWRYGTKMSPFDQEFFLILNVAVGGTNGFFPDDVASDPPKPWTNTDSNAGENFWNGRSTWLPSWEQGEGRISENAALQVDYVRVYKLSSSPTTDDPRYEKKKLKTESKNYEGRKVEE